MSYSPSAQVKNAQRFAFALQQTYKAAAALQPTTEERQAWLTAVDVVDFLSDAEETNTLMDILVGRCTISQVLSDFADQQDEIAEEVAADDRESAEDCRRWAAQCRAAAKELRA